MTHDEFPRRPTCPIGPVAFWLGLLIFIAVIAGICSVVTAYAHEHAGIVYPGTCCNSAATSPTGDCAPIGDEYVTEGPDGYEIDLPIGAHPKLQKKGYKGVVPYSNVKEPISNDYHICLATDGAHRFCFFPKPGAV